MESKCLDADWHKNLMRVIELSKRMLGYAKTHAWDEFLAISEEREQAVAVLEQYFPGYQNADAGDVSMLQRSELKLELIQLFKLNQSLLQVCHDRKNTCKNDLIRSKQFFKVSAQYRNIAK